MHCREGNLHQRPSDDINILQTSLGRVSKKRLISRSMWFAKAIVSNSTPLYFTLATVSFNICLVVNIVVAKRRVTDTHLRCFSTIWIWYVHWIYARYCVFCFFDATSQATVTTGSTRGTATTDIWRGTLQLTLIIVYMVAIALIGLSNARLKNSYQYRARPKQFTQKYWFEYQEICSL